MTILHLSHDTATLTTKTLCGLRYRPPKRCPCWDPIADGVALTKKHPRQYVLCKKCANHPDVITHLAIKALEVKP